jgi:hypothetical protein
MFLLPLWEKVSPQATDEGFLGVAARPLTRPPARATLSRKGRAVTPPVRATV